MLTTIDNPFDPYTQPDEWAQYDTAAGYNTGSYLARITITSEEMSETDQDLALEQAIDEIIKENILGIYVKVPVPS